VKFKFLHVVRPEPIGLAGEKKVQVGPGSYRNHGRAAANVTRGKHGGDALFVGGLMWRGVHKSKGNRETKTAPPPQKKNKGMIRGGCNTS